MKVKSIVGDLINFRGLVYSPMNENGVIFLFGRVADDLNMYIEEIKPGYPDCIARRFTGKGWQRVAVEFEYYSSNFKSHKHDADDCDIIICWEHDWKDCPIEVIALKEVIKDLENSTPARPEKPSSKEEKEFSEFLKEYPDKVKTIYTILDQKIRQNSPDVWRKELNKPGVNYYSPERVFIYLELQKQGVKLTLFTRGEKIEGVKPFNYGTSGEKWGYLHIINDTQIEHVLPAISKSLKIIKETIKRNEPTGWYATLSDENVESK